jgi:hypothetical protein
MANMSLPTLCDCIFGGFVLRITGEGARETDRIAEEASTGAS